MSWPAPAPEAPPGLYQLCMPRLRMAELWRMSPNAATAVVGIVLIKVFRMTLGETSIIEVPFRVRDVDNVADVDGRFAAPMEEATDEMLVLDFEPLWTFTQASELARPASVGRAFLSPDKRTLAQRMVTELNDGETRTAKTALFLCSGVDGESRLWTVDAPRDIDSPLEPFTERVVGAPADVVWERHQQRVDAGPGPYPVYDEAMVRAMIDIDNARFCDLMIARGLYAPLPQAPNKT
jgi:hypothetical protein